MVRVGIIAEDSSDIETLLIFIRRITDARFKTKKYAAQGCGKIKSKCCRIAKNWLSEKVTHIIICHDLDSGDTAKYKKLHKELYGQISSFPNHKKIISIIIPIEEIEAWFLYDTDALNKKFSGMNLKAISNPEKIVNPKEFIEKGSRKRCKPRYISTIHNPELAKITDISKIKKKCSEFRKFYDFVCKVKD